MAASVERRQPPSALAGVGHRSRLSSVRDYVDRFSCIRTGRPGPPRPARAFHRSRGDFGTLGRAMSAWSGRRPALAVLLGGHALTLRRIDHRYDRKRCRSALPQPHACVTLGWVPEVALRPLGMSAPFCVPEATVRAERPIPRRAPDLGPRTIPVQLNEVVEHPPRSRGRLPLFVASAPTARQISSSLGSSEMRSSAGCRSISPRDGRRAGAGS